MKTFFLATLVFVPITLVADYLGASPLTLFILASLAIIGLTKFLTESTEELAHKSGPALGGLLNATFGNAPELIIGLFALSAGLVDLVKASIIGSILGNLLLVLGTAIFAGGLRHREQTFNKTAARANVSVLLLASIALVVPAVFSFTAPGVSALALNNLSIVVAVLMMVSYVSLLFFSLYTHKHLYVEDGVEEGQGWSIRKSVSMLLASTIAIAAMSEILVGALRPLIANFGWSELFIGVIVIAIIGNTAEHAAAVTIARKNRMDLTLQIAIGSATQIMMFVAPILVLVSIISGTGMNLVFNAFELAGLVFAIFIANSIIEDGETHWFEGGQLLIAYAIIAVAFYLHP